jgi:hypothetical protein
MSSLPIFTWKHLAVSLAAFGMATGAAAAQAGYRLRLDAGAQTAAFRGVTLDSIPVADTVGAPGQGPTTSDGYAVQCLTGAAYCTFFRPGPERRGSPATVAADLTVWGLGLPGVSVHATGRLGVDLGTADVWPGTEPAVQLLQGYAEYAVPRATARLGRQIVASRLGTTGFDGAGVVVRDPQRGLEVQGYAGWGLERGVALPVTSPALNPLDDFQPRQRQLVAGAGAGWRSAIADVRLDYQREVDPRSDYFVSERIALGGALRPLDALRVTAGADYDLAAGWWGSADASLGYTYRRVHATLGVRRYRPHFDLWTIWGAFSPVPYHSVQASVSVTATPEIELRGRYERYRFEDAEAATPLFNSVPNDGWRWEVGVTATPREGWTLDGGYRRELGPGAAATGLDGNIAYRPTDRLTLSLTGSTIDRPLEFRFNEAVVHAYGVDAQLAPMERLRVGLTAFRYEESHRRPDAGAFDWNQVRLSLRVVMLFGNDADLRGLPPAIRLLPGGRAAR